MFSTKKRTLSKQIPGLAQVDISPRWSALYVVDWSLNSWSPAEGVSEFQPPEVGKWCFCWKFSFQLLRVCQGLLADFAQTFPLWNLIKVQVPWEKASLLNGWWNTSHSSYVHNVILVETWFLQPSWVDFIPLRVRKFGNWKCLGRSYIHGRKWQVYQVLIMFWLIQSINLHTNLPKQNIKNQHNSQRIPKHKNSFANDFVRACPTKNMSQLEVICSLTATKTTLNSRQLKSVDIMTNSTLSPS